jgi:hypothetical protein
LDETGIVGRLILRWILKKLAANCEVDAAGSGSRDGICEHGDKPSASIKGGEFLV